MLRRILTIGLVALVSATITSRPTTTLAPPSAAGSAVATNASFEPAHQPSSLLPPIATARSATHALAVPTSPITAVKPVDGTFYTFSFELCDFVENIEGSAQAGFINHLREVRARSQRPIVLRIGGNSQDRALFSGEQAEAIIRNDDGSVCKRFRRL